mmetsp:Transcript_2353/g.4974  ORF Transcript_2353/g.4974 Transcript_2353/m.4974 type:complete len:364 (-) Transcript_2353:113-1204(-)
MPAAAAATADTPEDHVAEIVHSSDVARLVHAASALSTSFAQAQGVPKTTASAVIQSLRLEELEETGACSKREAHVALLDLLVELCRLRPADIQETAAALVELPPLATRPPPGVSRRGEAPPAPPPTLLQRLLVIMADEFEESFTGCLFVHGCHLLVLAIAEEASLADLLCRCGALRMVAHCLQEASKVDTCTAGVVDFAMATEVLPFADAAMRLIHAVICAPSFHSTSDPNADLVLDAVVQALHRFLPEDATSLSVQPIHKNGLAVLGKMARLTQDLGQRIIYANGMALGMRLLAIVGATSDEVGLALWYWGQLATVSRHSAKKLSALGAAEVAERAMQKYPTHKEVQAQGERVVKVCRSCRF